MTIPEISAGTHKVELRKGDEVARESVEIAREGYKKLMLKLAKPMGGLNIVSNPPKAEIFVDGLEISSGETPALLKDIPVGRHTVELNKGELYAKAEVVVRDGEFEKVELKLARKKGDLSIVSDPPGARITLDGRGVGITPKTIKDVDVGGHQITLTMENYLDAEKSVTVTEDGAEISANLFYAPVFLKISGAPAGVSAYIEGRAVGLTPVNAKIIPGKFKVSLIKEGFINYSKTIEVMPGVGAKLDYKLEVDRKLVDSITFKRKAAKIATISGLGLAVVSTGLAVLFKTQADSAYSKYKKELSPSAAKKYRDEVNSNNTLSTTFWGVAGVGLAAGGISFSLIPQYPDGTEP